MDTEVTLQTIRALMEGLRAADSTPEWIDELRARPADFRVFVSGREHIPFAHEFLRHFRAEAARVHIIVPEADLPAGDMFFLDCKDVLCPTYRS